VERDVTKAVKWAAMAVVAALVVAGLWYATREETSAVLVQNAVAHPRPDGTLAITLDMSNQGGPVAFTGLTSPEVDRALVVGGGPYVLPAGSEPSLALDGAHGVFEGVSGPVEAGRLIPLRLTFGDGTATARARVMLPDEADPHAMHAAMGHGMTVEAGEVTLSMDVEEAEDGWIVRIEAPGLEFSADAADGAHVPGQGHGHLYLNGLKLQRVYAKELRIGALPPGRYELTLSLNANDHRAYAVDGTPLTATATIEAR
jgi:hypothetical protein